MPLTRLRPILALTLSLAAPVARAQEASIPSPQLARVWDTEHVSPPLPPLLDHAEVVKRLNEVANASPGSRRACC